MLVRRSSSGLFTTLRSISGPCVATSETMDATGPAITSSATIMMSQVATDAGIRRLSHRYSGANVT